MKLKLKIYNKERNFTKSNYWDFVNKKIYKHNFFFKIKKYLQLVLKKYLKIRIENISNKQIDQSFVSFPTDRYIILSQSKLICQILNIFFSKLNLHYANNDYLKIFDEYKKIFRKSKIKNLEGGIGFNNGLFVFTFNKLLNTEYFVESGSYRGFSSYLIGSRLNKKQKFISFDINLSNLEWVSKKIKYFEQDIEESNIKINWKDCIIFYDDHCSHYERLLFSVKNNVRYLIFDDDVSHINLHSDGNPPVPTLKMLMDWRNVPKKFKWTFNNEKCYVNLEKIKHHSKIINLYNYNNIPDIFDITGYKNSSSTSFLTLKKVK
jgi:hypothetical protein